MKLYIETMGCPKNFNDSEGMAGIWERRGPSVTDDPAEADVVLVNTCGFINDAKTGVHRSDLSIWRTCRGREHRSRESQRKLWQYRAVFHSGTRIELSDEMPEVDIFLGVNDYERLPGDRGKFHNRSDSQAEIFSVQPETFTEFSARQLEDNPYTATLRIAEGCDNCCAYCVIPQIRGQYRSRPQENIVAEAEDAGGQWLQGADSHRPGCNGIRQGSLRRAGLPELLRKSLPD